jgi:hypothetical protein
MARVWWQTRFESVRHVWTTKGSAICSRSSVTDRLTSAEAVREDIAVPAMIPLDEAERLAASSDLLQLFFTGEGRERKVGRVAVDLSLPSRSVLCPC